MQITNQTTTETPTQTQAPVENRFNFFDVADTLECAVPYLEYVQTLLSEMSPDLFQEIKFDGTKEDEHNKNKLLLRRPVLETFLIIAMHYIDRAKENIKETSTTLWGYVEEQKGGKK